MSKYEDLILDGRWKFKAWNNKGSAIFENIYNHTETLLTTRQINDVINGKTNVSTIMSRRIIGGHNELRIVDNSVSKSWKLQKYKYKEKSRQQ